MSAIDRFRFLAAAALVDGKLDAEEKPVLLKAAREMGVPENQIETVLRDVARGGDFTASVPKDPGERAQLFRSMVDVVAADGTIDPKEQQFFRKLSKAFQLNELEVEDILRAASDAKRH